MRSLVLASWCFCLLFAAVSSQNVGTQAAEEPLNLPISVCTAPGSCQTEADAVVLDSNWRWAHTVWNTINYCFFFFVCLFCFFQINDYLYNADHWLHQLLHWKSLGHDSLSDSRDLHR